MKIKIPDNQTKRIKELKAGLRKYGEHSKDCYKRLTIGAFCDCGLEEILKNEN